MKDEAISAKMDAAATEAMKDLPNHPDTKAGVGAWLGKWYRTAGYKRLCHLLMDKGS